MFALTDHSIVAERNFANRHELGTMSFANPRELGYGRARPSEGRFSVPKRPFLTAGLAALGATAVAVGPTLAQEPGAATVVTGSGKVSPNKAGTKRHPRGVKLRVKVHWETPADQEKPVVASADAFFPKGSLYNGRKYPKCAESKLARDGLSACPKKSIMGTGTATAYADTVLTHPKITVVNGGAKKVYLFTVLTNPARVRAPVVGTITKLRGKWAYKLHLEVPESLQVVVGIPIALRDFSVTAGGKRWAKDWLATTGCVGGKWPFKGETFYAGGGSGQFASSVRCRK